MTRAKPLQLSRSDNVVSVAGGFTAPDYRQLLAVLHRTITRRGFEDIVLDFTECTAAFPGPMLALCSEVSRRRVTGVDFDLRLPANEWLGRMFINSNWARHIHPERYPESSYRGYVRVPMTQFETPSQQQSLVDRMVDAILCSQTELSRGDLGAMEWALNEITDNVMNHADSPVGGLAQLVNYKQSGRVEFVVADPGIGIPRSLRRGHPDLRSDSEALDRAIREGVTGNSSLGQGNGLFGTLELCQVGSGYLHVHSSCARFAYRSGDQRTLSEQVPFRGTLVIAALDVSDPDALGEALRFGGRRYEPLDYIESHFELDDSDVLLVKLAEQADSFGARRAGAPLRAKLKNIVEMSSGRKVVVDFSDVPLVSSSFADEVFGKLLVEIGPLRFMQTITLQGMSRIVSELVDRAMRQRSRTGL